MNTKAMEVAKEVLLIVCSNADKAPAVVAERVSKAISKHFPEPYMSVKELEQQRDAALKLARDFAGYSENASKLGLTGAASAFCQCAKELRLALAPKEGK